MDSTSTNTAPADPLTIINPNIDFFSAPIAVDLEDPPTVTSLLFSSLNEAEANRRPFSKIVKWIRRILFRRKHNSGTGRGRMRDLAQYVIFLGLLTYLILYNRSFYYYRMKNAVDQALLQAQSDPNSPWSTFYGIGRPDGLWKFLTGPLLDFLFSDPVAPTDADTGKLATFVLHNNLLIGAPQLRQLRAPKSKCPGIQTLFRDPKVRAKFSTCYGAFDLNNNNGHAPFGLCSGGNLNSPDCTSVWQYSEASSGQLSAMFAGRFGFYPGGGYMAVLPLNSRQNATNLLSTMRSNYWMDRATRAIFIDFSLFNVPTSLFCTVRLLVEFSAAGLGVVRCDYRVLKLLDGYERVTGQSASAKRTFGLPFAAQLLTWCFLLYYLYEELHELVSHGRILKHLQNFWNLLDIVMLCFAGAWAGLSVYVDWFILPQIVQLLREKRADEYINLYDLSFHLEARGYAFAGLNFIAWTKLFKYLSLNRATTTVFETLQQAGGDLASYLVLFSTVFLALAQFGYICFGSDLDNYRSTVAAWMQLFQWVIGNYNYDELHGAHFLLGPLYFIGFVFIVYCVLLNLFLGIISDKYDDTEKIIAQRPPEQNYEISALFSRTIKHWLSVTKRLNWREQKQGIAQHTDFSVSRQLREPFSAQHFSPKKVVRQLISQQKNREQQIFHQWKVDLEEHGYSAEEIDSIFGGCRSAVQSSSADEEVSSAADSSVRLAQIANSFRSKTFFDNGEVTHSGGELVVPNASSDQLRMYEKIQLANAKVEQLEHVTKQMEAYCNSILMKLQAYVNFERKSTKY